MFNFLRNWDKLVEVSILHSQPWHVRTSFPHSHRLAEELGFWLLRLLVCIRPSSSKPASASWAARVTGVSRCTYDLAWVCTPIHMCLWRPAVGSFPQLRSLPSEAGVIGGPPHSNALSTIYFPGLRLFIPVFLVILVIFLICGFSCAVSQFFVYLLWWKVFKLFKENFILISLC